MFLYHYFEKKIGAFKNLSDLSINEAEEVLKKIKNDRPASLAAKSTEKYVQVI